MRIATGWTSKVLLGVAMQLGAGALAGADESGGEWPGPRLVSPAARVGDGRVATGCPSFSWTAMAGATGYELVVYEVGRGSSREPMAEPALRTTIPSGATSWTPNLGECLAPGRYGWAVGAAMREGEAPRWSRPALFRVEAAVPAAQGPTPSRLGESASQALPPYSASSASSGSTSQPPGLRAIAEEAFTPPSCVAGGETFSDVPASDPFCHWIEELARDGITAGCGGGRYCPDNPVTRRQLAGMLGQVMRGTATWHPAQGSNVLAPPAETSRSIVDDAPNKVGNGSSITIGADGLPVIAYWDVQADSLKIAHCNDVACSGQDESTHAIDTLAAGSPGSVSLAIGQDGLPIVAYKHGGAGLRVVHCDDAACAPGGETVTTLEATFASGSASLTIGSDGLPIIVYAAGGSVGPFALKTIHCDDIACAPGGESVQILDDPANSVGSFASIAIGADGLPVVSYYDDTAGDLKVAHCTDLLCAPGGDTRFAIDTATNAGLFTALTIGADGLPVISYFDADAGALKVAHCDDAACGGGGETITPVDNVSTSRSAITIGVDGLPLIVYEVNGVLRFMHCTDASCAGPGSRTRLGAPASGSFREPAVTIGADGLPVVSYVHATALDGDRFLEVAHCANAFCTPFFRRR